jgi:hypothetical protein
MLRRGTKCCCAAGHPLGGMSIFGLALIPFGFHMPAAGAALPGSGAGMIHLMANFFYYQAPKAGAASHTLACICGLSPAAHGGGRSSANRRQRRQHLCGRRAGHGLPAALDSSWLGSKGKRMPPLQNGRISSRTGSKSMRRFCM